MREQAIAEGQLMDPRLRVGAVNVPVNNFSFTDEDMTMVEVGVSQEFPAGQTRELSRKRMNQIGDRQGRGGARTGGVSCSARCAACGSSSLTSMRRASWSSAQQSVGRADARSARARYASGEGKQIEVLQAGLDVAMLREQQLDLDRDEAMRRAQLAPLAR